MITAAIARRYAQAFLDVAIERSETAAFEKDLEQLDQVCAQHGELMRVLANRTIPLKERKAVLAGILAKVKISTDSRHFALLLLDKNRLQNLHSIVEEFKRLAEEKSKMIRAVVTSAFPLESKTVEEIRRQLAESTGREVQIEIQEDATLMGGIRIRLGDTVFDGSVATHLENLKRQMIEGGLKHGH